MNFSKILIYSIILLLWLTAVIAEYKNKGTMGILIMSYLVMLVISLGKAAQLRLK